MANTDTATAPTTTPPITDLAGTGDITPEQRQTLLDKMTDITGKKVKSDEGIEKNLEGGTSYYSGISEQARQATQASIKSIPEPWNADQMREKFSTNPLAAFGSAASVFGILAASFTHQPMMNALNASAAAINAERKGDEDAYDKAYHAWKDNTALAIKRHEMMHQSYTDAMELLRTQPALAQAQLSANATRFQDKQLQSMLEQGMWPQLDELIAKREEAKARTIAAQEKLEALNDQRTLKRLQDDSDQTPEKRLQALKIEDRLRIAPRTAQEAAVRQAYRDAAKNNTEPTPEQLTDIQARLYRGNTSKAEQESLANHRIAELTDELGPLSITEQGIIRKAYTATGEKAAGKLAQLDLALNSIRERTKAGETIGPDDRLKILKEAMETPEGTTPMEDMIPAVKRWIAGDNSALRMTQGYGAVAAANRRNWQAAINSVGEEMGLTPSEIAQTVRKASAQMAALRISAGAVPQALRGALTKMVGMQAASESFSETMLKNLDILVKLGSKIDATGVPVMNAWVNAGKKAVGSPEVRAFDTQWQATIPEIARIVSSPNMTGVLSDHARAEASTMLPKYVDIKSFSDSAQLIRRDAFNRAKSIDDEIQRIQRDIDSGHITPTTEGKTPPPLPGSIEGLPTITDKAGYDALPSGTSFLGSDGQRYRKP